MLSVLFVLSGCVMPPLPAPGQVETLPTAAATGGAPIIAVAPNVATAGDFISVSGAGWPANQTVYVNIESVQGGEKGATTVSVTTTDADGRFTASFFLPEEAARSDTPELTVVVYGAEPSQRVTATLTVQSEGTPVTATGTSTAPTATVATAT
ncbi:MAG TPA: hypothetical protein PKE45_19370, partial [Caldilineaceae bacterium]|nr:hypothetical protein [Caldilineaceae bacterium]